MLRKIFLIVLVSALPVIIHAQDIDEVFGDRNEVYFTFKAESRTQVNRLSSIISIDRVTPRLQVFAYANRRELAAFRQLGIEFRILPHPGTLINPFMRDEVDIRNIAAWDFYPTYDAYVDMMYQYEADFPDLCEVISIGYTYEERELLVMRITDNVGQQEGEPEFLYSSSIHGDETTGYVLMLRLIDYLLTEYDNNPRITSMVDGMDIYICPLANPDGSYNAGNSNIYGATRYNAHGVDLNRNYPDPEDGPHPDGNPWQIETINFMNFAEEHSFVSGANIHGGAEVLNYPWDTWPDLAADNDWWVYVCREYADTVHLHAPSDYLTGFENGITNGYQWYTIAGGRQDYMNYFQQCREFTLEISDVKLLPASQLPALWEYNYRSFLNYIEQAMFGVRGKITDSATGEALKAEVFVLNHEEDSSWVYSTDHSGNYHRLLYEGTYDIKYSKTGYLPQTFNDVEVDNRTATVIDVELVKAFSSVDELDEIQFNIYPNPAIGNFTRISSPVKPLSISVFDMEGRSVSNVEVNGPDDLYLDISDLKPGTYIIAIRHEDGVSRKKLIRQ
ncbi:MAG TPA: M14 family zinc carboxypeptidase [Bacteroidales bacterium]|nr:M14 family zinc carboxypeptidase [Bacteroidales bacterium]